MPAIYATAAAQCGEVAAAVAFNERFIALPGVKYEWAVKHARDQYAQAETAFKAVDEKAASILGYLGTATGVFAAGVIAKLADGQIDPRIALAATPSFILAGLALVFVALARRPFDCAYPPTACDAADRANWYGPDGTEAEASMIGAWHLATALVQHATDKKTRWFASATWMLVSTVAGLVLPLATALILRF